MMGYGSLGELALGEQRVSGGTVVIGITARMTAAAKARPGPTSTGILSAKSIAMARSRAPGGIALPARGRAMVKLRAPGGIKLSAYVAAKVRSTNSLTVVVIRNPPRLPLFIQSGPQYWPGGS